MGLFPRKAANDIELSQIFSENFKGCFSKVDSFTKDLIRTTIYEFYDQKICPTLDMLFEKIQERTKGEDYEFPYGRTWLSKLVKSLGFCYCRSNNRQVLMESPRIMAWRWEFLRKIRN